MKLCLLPVAAAIVAQPLASDDCLELSVLNEVEHALSISPTNPPPLACEWHPATGGLSRTAIALRIVSSQRADGRWFCGTNDVTAAVREILEQLVAESP